jgi:hypothetical protein
LFFETDCAQYEPALARPASEEGQNKMDELLDRLVANVGICRDVAEKAVGIILDFLMKEGPADSVRALMEKLPGATAVQEASAGNSGGMFSMGGLMGAGTKMMAAGLSMTEVQSVTREVIGFAREKVGEDTIGEIVSGVPGLSQFV